MTNEILRQEEFSPHFRFQIVQGDITQETVDAIVNAANAQLQHGGGVAGVIARAGGADITTESRAWIAEHGPVGHAIPAFTTAGNLPCRYVIHAVGPIWGSGDEDAKLAAAVTGSLQRAEELEASSLSLPAISTGIYGFPPERAAGVIFSALRKYAAQNPHTQLELVRLVLYGDPTVTAFLSVWDRD